MKSEMVLYFDNLAPTWDNAPDKYNTREKLLDMMELKPNSLIADVGCGKGVMFEHLLKTTPQKIIAIDISGEMIRLAKELHSDNRIEYINGDFYTLPLPLLDVVIFFNSYPHFINKDDLSNKLAKVIKKGGMMIVAHSLSKNEINGFHTGQRVSTLSVPLQTVAEEASKYEGHFFVDSFVDNEEMYFIKMVRR